MLHRAALIGAVGLPLLANAHFDLVYPRPVISPLHDDGRGPEYSQSNWPCGLSFSPMRDEDKTFPAATNATPIAPWHIPFELQTTHDETVWEISYIEEVPSEYGGNLKTDKWKPIARFKQTGAGTLCAPALKMLEWKDDYSNLDMNSAPQVAWIQIKGIYGNDFNSSTWDAYQCAAVAPQAVITLQYPNPITDVPYLECTNSTGVKAEYLHPCDEGFPPRTPPGFDAEDFSSECGNESGTISCPTADESETSTSTTATGIDSFSVCQSWSSSKYGAGATGTSAGSTFATITGEPSMGAPDKTQTETQTWTQTPGATWPPAQTGEASNTITSAPDPTDEQQPPPQFTGSATTLGNPFGVKGWSGVVLGGGFFMAAMML